MPVQPRMLVNLAKRAKLSSLMIRFPWSLFSEDEGQGILALAAGTHS